MVQNSIITRRMSRGCLAYDDRASVMMKTQPTAETQQKGVVTSIGPVSLPSLQVAPIPRPLTPLVGREQEVEAVLAFLAKVELRLLTLTGPGGVGKTRLALRSASRIKRMSGTEVVFVNLGPITEGTLVRPAIAQAIAVPVGDHRTLMTRLLQAIGDRSLLLVLDNFEQVISEAVMVAELLSQCPNVKALVTSRMPLHIQGEQEFPVPPLDSPGPDASLDLAGLAANDAVSLFVQRAKATTPEFELTERNARTVAAICSRLDGLPLAIELAAARIRIFTAESLLFRLNDRLAILTGGPRDVPSRQQTMRSAIQWSFDLLTHEEQVIFRRIAMFAGSFSLGEAHRILDFSASIVGGDRAALDTPDTLECLLSLLDKSLIIRVNSGDNEYRFRILETIREFGFSQLDRAGETDLVRRRMLTHYADLVASLEMAMVGPEQHLHMRRLDDEVGNLRVALQAGLDLGSDATEDGVRLASYLWRYWLVRGYVNEGVDWLVRLLERANGLPIALNALALQNLGNLVLELSQYDRVKAYYEQSLELFRSIGAGEGTANLLNNLALLQIIQGEFSGARGLLEQSLAIRRATDDDDSALPTTFSNLGDIATFEADYDLAIERYDEALTISRRYGNRRRIALDCYNLGMSNLLRGDLEAAGRWFAEGLEYALELGDAFSHACLLLGTGRLSVRRGSIPEGMRSFIQALRILHEMSSRRLMFDVIDAIAAAAAVAGRFDQAARLIGGTSAFRRQSGIGITASSRIEQDDLVATLVAELGQQGFQRHQDAGRLVSLDEAASEGLALAREVSADPTDPARDLPPGGVTRSTEAAAQIGLTPREREVLVLIAHGHSDKEIADRLFISPRTAMTHVGNILAKLGVNKRTMATRVAIEQGLVDPPTNGQHPV